MGAVATAPSQVVMAARKRKRVSKRAHSSTVKAKLGHVIKSLQDIKKNVISKKTRGKRGTRGPAKTVRDILPSIYMIDEEPITLDSPTLRRPARETLRSATSRSPLSSVY